MPVSLVVGTVKGGFLYRSEDRQSWTLEGPLLKGWKVTAAGHGIAGDYLLATASSVYGPAVHRSDDLREWRQVETSPVYEEDTGWKLNQIWTFARAGERLFCGVDEAGLFKSDDAGETWQLAPGLTDHPSRSSWVPGFGGLCAHHVLADPRDPAQLWCGISAVGVFRSADGGASWEAANHGVPCILEDETHGDIGFCVHAIAADPDDAQRIWRMDHRGMFRSADGGRSWERIENGLPSSFGFPLVCDPQTKTLFTFMLESDEYRVPHDGRFVVYRTTDGGDSWHECTSGLPQSGAWGGVLRGAMAVDGQSPGGVYVGSTSGEVYASSDGGDAWQRLPGTLPRILSVDAFVEA